MLVGLSIGSRIAYRFSIGTKIGDLEHVTSHSRSKLCQIHRSDENVAQIVVFGNTWFIGDDARYLCGSWASCVHLRRRHRFSDSGQYDRWSVPEPGIINLHIFVTLTAQHCQPLSQSCSLTGCLTDQQVWFPGDIFTKIQHNLVLSTFTRQGH